MKNILFLSLALFLVACGGAPEGEKVEAQECALKTSGGIRALGDRWVQRLAGCNGV